jgi:N-acetylgalactosamine-6-sulfatase
MGLAVIGVVPQSGYADPAGANTPPNIIFILADDLGWGDLGCYGHPQMKTPNIDRLAARGILFTNAYSGASVCSPTRAGMLTGRNPGELGIHGHMFTSESNKSRGMPEWLPLPEELPNIAHFLKENGYATAHFGKWHLGGPWQENAPPPIEYGYDEALTYVSTGPQLGTLSEVGNGKHPETDYSKSIADLSIDFIERHKDRPFFINAWLHVPHTVLIPTQEMMEAYPDLVPFGPNLNEPFRKQYGVDGFSTPQQVYYSMVTNMDAQMGRIFAKLEEAGLSENTLIVFSSDNGPEVGLWPLSRHSAAGLAGPFRGMKRSLYEGGIRVPLITSWPARQVRAGVIDRTTVACLTDLTATFAAAAGLKWPETEGNDSVNLLPAIEGEPMDRGAPLFWSYRERMAGHPMNFSPMGAIRSGDWKLLANPDGSRVELYHLTEDPSEVDNRADDYPEKVKALKTALTDWLASLPSQETVPPYSGSSGHPWTPVLQGR